MPKEAENRPTLCMTRPQMRADPRFRRRIGGFGYFGADKRSFTMAEARAKSICPA